MKIFATDEQMKQMAANAVNASQPMGMGHLEFEPDDSFTSKDIEIETGSNPGIFLDYVGGRMVKFTAWKRDGHWKVRDLDSAYESWVCKYPTWQALAESVGAKTE